MKDGVTILITPDSTTITEYRSGELFDQRVIENIIDFCVEVEDPLDWKRCQRLFDETGKKHLPARIKLDFGDLCNEAGYIG